MKRPTLFDTVVIPKLDTIKEMKSNGKTNAEIAKYLGIGTRTFEKYLSRPELKFRMEQGRTILIEKLQNTLYDKALGKCKQTKTIINIEEKEGKIIKRKTHTEVIKIAPDLGAIVFALCNLDPAHWKRTDREEIDKNIKLILADSVNMLMQKELKNRNTLGNNVPDPLELDVNVSE